MIHTSVRRFFFDNRFTNPKLIFYNNSLIMSTLYTTQMALAFHPDSRVKTQEAYKCVDNFLNSLSNQESSDETPPANKDTTSSSKTKKIQKYKTPKKGSMASLAIQVLNEKITLHYTDIWSEIEKLGFPTRGDTPANTLGSELRRRVEIFKKCGKGIYGLHTYKTIK